MGDNAWIHHDGNLVGDKMEICMGNTWALYDFNLVGNKMVNAWIMHGCFIIVFNSIS